MLESWLFELRELETLCECAARAQGARAVRQICSIWRSAPGPLVGLFPGLVDEARVEILLACEAPEQALLSLLHGRMGYLLSESLDGRCFATIAIPGIADEESSIGRSPALALVGALSRILQQIAGPRIANRVPAVN
jgi:hypothetical protein